MKKQKPKQQKRDPNKPCQGPRPLWMNRCDDHCTKCGEDLGYDTLADLFRGIRFEDDKNNSARYTCPHCGSIQLIELNYHFTVRYTGKRRKGKKR